MKQLTAGETINGRYVIESLLGMGGMGSVYSAMQLPLSRRVALKIMGALGTNGMTAQQFVVAKKRFFREASLCARLRHPNIITVYDYGEVESGPVKGSYFLAMEYLPGQTLDAKINDLGMISPEEAVAIAIEITRGLREAHSHGLVHRDLKPENVMLVPSEEGADRVVILDFGLVREFEAQNASGATQDNSICGTPKYIAPEQLFNKTVDPRSDLYSLGLIIYESITGEYPYPMTSLLNLFSAHMNQQVAPLREHPKCAKVSAEFEQLVAKLLEKEPSKRYQSSEELLRDLRALPEAVGPSTSGFPIIASGAAPTITLNTTNTYHLGARIAATQGSIVYEASHPEFGRRVAVKLLVPSTPEEGLSIDKNLPTLASLRNPSNVRVYDLGTATTGDMTVPFMVMELLRGEKLSQRLTKVNRLPTAQVYSLGSQLIQAVAEAHSVGLVHGRLEPDRIMLLGTMGDDLLKVLGYPTKGHIESSGQSIAPLPERVWPFVAPEVIGGGRPKETSDIYAIGKLLLLCLGGESAVMNESKELLAILEKAIANRAAERYDSLKAFWTAWRTCDLTPSSKTAPTSYQPGRMTAPFLGKSASLPSVTMHNVWVLGGDPVVDGPMVENATKQLAMVMAQPIPLTRQHSIAQTLVSGLIEPPSIVIFGASHVNTPDPLLKNLIKSRGTRKILISTQLSIDTLSNCVNALGLDQVVVLPSTTAMIAESIKQQLDLVDMRILKLGLVDPLVGGSISHR